MPARKSNARKRTSSAAKSARSRGLKREPSPKWWQRSAIWIVGLVSAVFLAIATAFGTGIGEHLYSAVDSKLNSALSQPIEVESASYIREGGGSVLAFQHTLTDDQVRQLTHGTDVLNDGVAIDYNEYTERIAQSGGALTGDAFVQIILHNISKGQVAITGIQIVKSCSQPLTGTLLFSPNQGSESDIPLGFNLDEQPTYAQFWNENSDKFYGNYFAQRTIILNSDEIDPLIIHVETSHQFCKFSFTLDVDYGNRTITEKVSPSRGSFSVTADLSTPTRPTSNDFYVLFNKYKEMYVGGIASPKVGQYVQVNPQTYKWG